MTVPEDNVRWVSLREAAEVSNASVSALRRWYRHGLIRTLTVEGTHGDQRLVDLDEVLARAADSPNLGRRRGTRRDEADAVTEALLDQVAAMAMEIAELRERVSALERAQPSPS